DKVLIVWDVCAGTGGATYQNEKTLEEVKLATGAGCTVGFAWFAPKDHKLLAAASGSADSSLGLGDRTTQPNAEGATGLAVKELRPKAWAAAREAMKRWADPTPTAPPATAKPKPGAKPTKSSASNGR